MVYIPSTKDVFDGKRKKEKSAGYYAAVAGATIALIFVLYIPYSWTTIEYQIEQLNSPYAKNRRWSVDQIVKRGEWVGPMIRKLVKTEGTPTETKRLAIFILGEIQFIKAKDDILHIFVAGKLPHREQAAYALGRMGDSTVVPILIGAYKRAPKGLKLKILVALGEIGNRAATMLLIEAINDKDELIQQTASFALKKVKEKSKI